jgi:hypothetical protein
MLSLLPGVLPDDDVGAPVPAEAAPTPGTGGREQRVATLDRIHFTVIRPGHTEAFELVP